MKRQPVQISLFELIHSSDRHRNTLEKFLAKVHIPTHIEVNTLDTFMDTMLTQDTITFSKDELPQRGKNHNDAIFITVGCRNKWVPKVLIDGGSGVNIIPLSVAKQLEDNEEKLSVSNLVIRDFYRARRNVLGEVSVSVMVWPAEFDITFQILETVEFYNMLLRRPQIHKACAMPSNVHQTVKFVYDDKIITVKNECEVQLCTEIDISYVGERAGDPSTAQNIEIVNMIRMVMVKTDFLA